MQVCTRRLVLVSFLAALGLLACASPRSAWNEKLDYGEFAFVMGEGSGWHGYDVLRIAATGEARYTFAKVEGQRTVWRAAEFVVEKPMLARLRAALNDTKYFSLRSTYQDADVDDGTQWFVKVRVGENRKGVFCDNAFPPEIVRLSEFVHAEILDPRLREFASAKEIDSKAAKEPERFE